MRNISFSEILNLNISPQDCINWAREVIINKNSYKLPPKTSIKFNDSKNFFTTMPSMLPDLGVFGLKMVSRLQDRIPALKADILLYDSSCGELLTLMDGTWITAWRTGAIAALTTSSLKPSGSKIYSFIGLGNTARTTLLCLDAIQNHEDMQIYLFAYKNQHELFIERFSNFPNLHFTVFTDLKQMLKQSDVVISCITATNDVLAEPSDFKDDVLVIPVHTRGFQNCDLEFDHIFCDDISHISSFKYFKQYKSVTEMTDVINNKDFSITGKRLAYNIGVSTQDIFFAKKIYDYILKADKKLEQKFWV